VALLNLRHWEVLWRPRVLGQGLVLRGKVWKGFLEAAALRWSSEESGRAKGSTCINPPRRVQRWRAGARVVLALGASGRLQWAYAVGFLCGRGSGRGTVVSRQAAWPVGWR
jgi:hypothetical protein